MKNLRERASLQCGSSTCDFEQRQCTHQHRDRAYDDAQLVFARHADDEYRERHREKGAGAHRYEQDEIEMFALGQEQGHGKQAGEGFSERGDADREGQGSGLET